MDHTRLRHLLTRYFDNTISGKDCKELLACIEEEDSAFVSVMIDELVETTTARVRFSPARQEQIYEGLLSDIRRRQDAIPELKIEPQRARSAGWLRIAAVLTAGVSLGLLIFQHSTRIPDTSVQIAISNTPDDILLPDGDQALLTLADGRSITLDDSVNSKLLEGTGILIRRTADGSILYDAQSNALTGQETQFNTFSTPKGHSSQLLLPDGTSVWLNTASSVRYPLAFSGEERKIFLTGEAYFEVAHDTSRPFKVEANGSVIQVTGTHFNVSAYEDEGMVTTTLMEGSVNVLKEGEMVTLKPGEQAVVDEKTGKIRQSAADTWSVLAWKNGYFWFENASIEDIMDKISRWYDIGKITYQGRFDDRFTGTFQRSKSVSLLFENLEKLAPVQFEIKERSVRVMR